MRLRRELRHLARYGERGAFDLVGCDIKGRIVTWLSGLLKHPDELVRIRACEVFLAADQRNRTLATELVAALAATGTKHCEEDEGDEGRSSAR